MSKIKLSAQEQSIIDELFGELDEDLSRWDDEGEEWLETALDCPSNDTEYLQNQLVELVGDERYELIMEKIVLPYMRKIAK